MRRGSAGVCGVALVLALATIGLMSGCAPAPSAAPTVPSAATPAPTPGFLTAEDVSDVLASLEATLPEEGGPTENGAVLEKCVDIPSFAASILTQVPPSFVDDGLSTKAQAKSRIAKAVSAFRGVASREGTQSALELVWASTYMYNEPGTGPYPKDEVLVAPISLGLDPLDFWFREADFNGMWRWDVVDVSVLGTGTAEISYTATSTSDAEYGEPNNLVFKVPTARYTKVLSFSYGADGRWRLSGWSNFAEFERTVRANIAQKDGTKPQFGWAWWVSENLAVSQ